MQTPNVKNFIVNYKFLFDDHVVLLDSTLAFGIGNTGSDKRNLSTYFMQDFDYNTINTFDLGQLKMHYINCNRRIFANSDKDLINILLLDKDLQALFIKATSNFKPEIENMRHSIANMFDVKDKYKFELSEKKKYTLKNLLGINIDTITKKSLNDEFINVDTALKLVGKLSINRMSINVLLGLIDSYIFEDLKCNNIFLYRLKPSIILSNIFKGEILNLDETERFLAKIIDTYEALFDVVKFINFAVSGLVIHNCPNDIYTPFVLKYNIFIKWHVEFTIRTIISQIKNLNETDKSFSKQIIIYSKNANSIFEKLSQAINLIADGKEEEAIGNLNIQKIVVPNNIFHTPKFDSYEIAILDKKYLIKKFNWVDTPSLPSGLSTAYLNVHDKFTSAGYIAFENKNHDSNDSLFMSVEEKMDNFFITDNFEIFENDEDQALWFIHNFFNILDKLILYKIKVITPAVLFAVKRDNKRWRFRINDIKGFECVTNESPYENHNFLIVTLRYIYNTIKKQSIRDYIKHLMRHAEDLKSAKLHYYIEILISDIDQKVSTI